MVFQFVWVLSHHPVQVNEVAVGIVEHLTDGPFFVEKNGPAPLPELMDRKKRDIMERKGDKEDENKRQKQQKESSAAAL